jgi:hypothetical protein
MGGAENVYVFALETRHFDDVGWRMGRGERL